ncbi:hypothetical protein C8R45DRAFT_1192448 [Mycena sanguinolenta]|nr:hypothetical protein C8R45DRAFT_1192448 [Mycena sanguinolenta]
MPSLFSRARTASTPSKSKHKPPPPPPALSYPYPAEPGTPVGEFGQQQAFFSQRPRSLSQGGQAQAAGEGGYGAVRFLLTTVPVDLNTPWASTSSSSAAAPSAGSSTADLALFGAPGSSASASSGRVAYGLLSPVRDTSACPTSRLVAVLCAKLERTGVSTPFVLCSLAPASLASSGRPWRPAPPHPRLETLTETGLGMMEGVMNAVTNRAWRPHTSSACVSAGGRPASEDVLVPYIEILRQECPRSASTLSVFHN